MTMYKELANQYNGLSNPYAFIINGVSGVGKDLVVSLIREHFPERYIGNISSVDPIKEWLFKLGIENQRDSETRKLISDIKIAMDTHSDMLLEHILYRVLHDDKDIFFIHLRDKESVKKLNELFKDQGIPYCNVLVRRAIVENNNKHLNEGDIDALSCIDDFELFPAKYRINNNSTIEALDGKIKDIFRNMVAELVYDFLIDSDVNKKLAKKLIEETGSDTLKPIQT